MRKLLAVAALALPFAIAGCASHENMYYSAPLPPAYSEIGQRGFRDGFDAARHDISKGWAPDVDRHGRFRNPPVPRPALEDYRRAFREGYERVFHRERRY
jgi:hypothetical protein